MKTINPNIDMFDNLEKAKKSFEKSKVPCQLLEAKTFGRFTTYFIDRSKQAIIDWSNKYVLLAEK